MATKIYIAGKITGDPDYKAKFEAAAEAYKKKGYTDKSTIMPDGESLETPNCSQKELTALKAVYYLAERNPRLKHGGTWVEDIHNMETCQRIPFVEAMQLVCNMLYCSDNEEAKP